MTLFSYFFDDVPVIFMMSVTSQRLLSLLVRAMVLFTAFPVHECAHAITAHWLGDDTAKEQGRISLNPFKHINLWGALFMLFAGFGAAKPVPIDPRNFKKPKVGMAVSSLAGPLSNLLMAYVFMVLYHFTVMLYIPSYYYAFDVIMYITEYAVILNVGLAVFNLLPIPPLDGSRIVTVFLPEKNYFGIMKYERIIFAVLFVAVFSGFLDKPLGILNNAALNVLWTLTGWVDKLF